MVVIFEIVVSEFVMMPYLLSTGHSKTRSLQNARFSYKTFIVHIYFLPSFLLITLPRKTCKKSCLITLIEKEQPITRCFFQGNDNVNNNRHICGWGGTSYWGSIISLRHMENMDVKIFALSHAGGTSSMAWSLTYFPR